MDLELNDDQHELRAVAARLLDDQAPLSLARDYLEGRRDSNGLWETIAELGWYSIGAEEDDPFGVVGLCILAEQCGAHAAPLPLIDTALSVAAFSQSGTDPDTEIRHLLSGSATVALGVVEERSGWTLEPAETRIRERPAGGFLLHGTKLGVHHGNEVDFFAIHADAGGEPALALVPRLSAGVTVISTPGLDGASAFARVVLDGVSVPGEHVVHGRDALERLLQVGAVATVAEAIGAASTALSLAVGYARERRQFGRPIGTFQAVQHLLADAHVMRESAWATVLHAAGTLDEPTGDAAEAVAIAKAYGSRAAREVVEAALQVLGGIGFTWEHDLHLLQRRVLASERRFGDPLHHERTIADTLKRTAQAGKQ
jgi:alkylation response protein AidB-like acyl-CoA dehydrogenase